MPWSFLPKENQRESPLKSAKVTVRVTSSMPHGPRLPKNANRKAEKATAFPKIIVEKYKAM